jgi:hypothetical protein
MPSGLPEEASTFVVDLDGGTPIQVARGFDVSWSARGALAYRRVQHGSGFLDTTRLSVLPALGATERLVASGLPEWSQYDRESGVYDWSPDGRRIAFEGRRGIYVVQPDGGPPRRVSLSGTGSFGTGPYWSPDGKLLAYSGARGIQAVPARGGRPRLVARYRFEPTGMSAIDWQARPRTSAT